MGRLVQGYALLERLRHEGHPSVAFGASSPQGEPFEKRGNQRLPSEGSSAARR